MTRRLRRAAPRHAKTDLWVVPYADMMTLLFALFVVLHSMGRVELDRLARLRESIQFALVGDGGRGDLEERRDLLEAGPAGGELIDGIALVNRQSGPMIEFLLEILPEDFERQVGRSLEFFLDESTMVIEADTLAYFEPGAATFRPESSTLLVQLLQGLETHTLQMKVVVTFPRAPKDDDRSRLSSDRAERFYDLVESVPQVDPVRMGFAIEPTHPKPGPWEEQSRVRLEFLGSR